MKNTVYFRIMDSGFYTQETESAEIPVQSRIPQEQTREQLPDYRLIDKRRNDYGEEPFVTKEQLDEIVKEYPTPFHLYDEKGIRENARAMKEAFPWNKGFKEYFAVKATPILS